LHLFIHTIHRLPCDYYTTLRLLRKVILAPAARNRYHARSPGQLQPCLAAWALKILKLLPVRKTGAGLLPLLCNLLFAIQIPPVFCGTFFLVPREHTEYGHAIHREPKRAKDIESKNNPQDIQPQAHPYKRHGQLIRAIAPSHEGAESLLDSFPKHHMERPLSSFIDHPQQ